MGFVHLRGEMAPSASPRVPFSPSGVQNAMDPVIVQQLYNEIIKSCHNNVAYLLFNSVTVLQQRLFSYFLILHNRLQLQLHSKLSMSKVVTVTFVKTRSPRSVNLLCMFVLAILSFSLHHHDKIVRKFARFTRSAESMVELCVCQSITPVQASPDEMNVTRNFHNKVCIDWIEFQVPG